MTLSDYANIASVGGFLLAALGSLGGMAALWRKRKARKFEAEAEELYAYLRQKAGCDIYRSVWEFKPGTRGFALAEYLVERGKLFHREMGTYGLWAPSPDRARAD